MEKIKADFIDRMNRQKAEERNKVRKKEKQTDRYSLSSPVQFSCDNQTGSPVHTQTDYGLCVKAVAF